MSRSSRVTCSRVALQPGSTTWCTLASRSDHWDGPTSSWRATFAFVASGGWVILEDPDLGSWHFNPPAPGAERLIQLLQDAFLAGGGDLNAGRRQAEVMRASGLEPEVRAEVQALPPGHPYLRLPVQFSVSLEPRLLRLVSRAELEELRRMAEAEIAQPGRWGTTFTLVQTWARVSHDVPRKG